MNEHRPQAPDEQPQGQFAGEPGKVLRMGTMVRHMLEEVRRAPLDDSGRRRLRDVHDKTVTELKDVLSPELREELEDLSILFGEDVPSESELRIAQAQLVGWLEGLFHGIQAMLWAQQMQAQAQLGELRRQALPGGEEPQAGRGPGQYL